MFFFGINLFGFLKKQTKNNDLFRHHCEFNFFVYLQVISHIFLLLRITFLLLENMVCYCYQKYLCGKFESDVGKC